MTWYVKGFEGAAPLRDQLCHINTVEEGDTLLRQAIHALTGTAG